MKKGKIFTNCFVAIFAIIASLSFASCSADSSDSLLTADSQTPIQVEAPFSVVLKAYSDNQNITANYNNNNTTLFVFDENNDFYKQITVDLTYMLQAKPIEISCPGAKKVTVIAWAGVSSENVEISNMNQANIISDLQVSLKQNKGVVSSLPGDLFYGQVTINRPSTKSAAQELRIERKVSSVSLIAKGILKVLDSKEGNFNFVVKNTQSSFDCNGKLVGNNVEYVIPATFNKNNDLVSATTAILPNENIVVELYKDGKMIFSSENAQKSEKVAANPGEQVNLTFDLSRNNFNVLVSDWNTVIQIVTVG